MLPEVPTPAPADTSPVGFSSTEILITLVSGLLPFIISDFTFLKKFKFFKLFTDLFAKISLNGSPSSISN